MNPDLKLVLDTMSKHFEDRDARWEKRFTEHDEKWERKFLETDAAQDLRVSWIERAADALEQWRPEIEGSVDDLRQASTIPWRRLGFPLLLCWRLGDHLLRRQPTRPTGTASTPVHGRMVMGRSRP